MDTLTISYVPIADLKESEHAARVRPDEAIEQLKKSITEHSVIDPIIINSAKGRENVVLGGWMRVLACKALKHKTIPAIALDIPDLDKEKALTIRLNAIGGDWNVGALKEYAEDFLLDSGFEPTKLEMLYRDFLDAEDDNFSVEDELEKITEPKSTFGDLYELGPHRLLVGDATSAEDVLRVTGGEKVDMVYCDPPYNIGLDYNKGIGGKQNYGGKVDDKKTDAQYEAFLRAAMTNALVVSKKDAHHFWYCDSKYVGTVQSLYKELGIKYQRTALWVKNGINPTPKIAFSKLYEPCVYGLIGKPFLSPQQTSLGEILNKDIRTGNATADDILDMVDIWLARRVAGGAMEHATEKPVTLHDRPIKRCTQVGDSILSLFGGSGGEMIAADQLKRKVFMVEKDPVFADLIIRRYEHHSHGSARKVD